MYVKNTIKKKNCINYLYNCPFVLRYMKYSDWIASNYTSEDSKDKHTTIGAWIKSRPSSIYLKGLPDVSSKVIKLFFESEFISFGGQVKSVDLRKGYGEAVVEFSNCESKSYILK